MTRTNFLGGLRSACALGSMAGALAMMAVPMDVAAQDRGRSWQQGSQSQSNSNRGGNRDNQSASQSTSQSSNRGQVRNLQVQGQNGNRGEVRNLQVRGQSQSNVPERPASTNPRGNGGATTVPPRQVRPQNNNRPNQQNWNGQRRPDTNRNSGRDYNRGNSNWQNRQSGDGGRQAYDRNRQNNDWQRNRTYRDDNRNLTYRDKRHSGQSQNYRNWDRNWRNNDRYDWHRYRSTNRQVYRVGHYYAPYSSYRYRRLGTGVYVDSLFYGNRYWLNDPWHYRLPAVYGPYRWIRYYDDVLLVNIYSGQVVDVIYDFFW